MPPPLPSLPPSPWRWALTAAGVCVCGVFGGAASNGVDITGMDSAGNIEEEEDNTDDEEEDTA